MEPKIVFEDEEILVLEKPAGMVVNKAETTKAGETVQEWLEKSKITLRQTQGDAEQSRSIKNQKSKIETDSDFYKRAGIVHRLDKETSGLLLVAKTPETFENLQRQFKERKVKKTYLALVHGRVAPLEGEIRVPVGRLPWNRKRFGVLAGGREAATRYKAISNYTLGASNYTLLELYPETGRTHQIRVHLKYFSHPIFADPLYAGRKQARKDRKVLSRLFLHASKISFFHPASPQGGPKTNSLVSFESPLPEELAELLQVCQH